MDTTRDIIYRGFKLNDSAIRDNIAAGKITGCVVDSVDPSDMDVVQFMEKRSLQDGMDAGDPYLGARRFRMAGTLYGTSRAALYDLAQSFRAAMSPTLAHRELPADKGFRPLMWEVPTERTAEFPSGYIAQQALALVRVHNAVYQRDQHGGDAADALALPWQATFVIRDPRVTSQEQVDTSFAQTVLVSGATGVAATDIITSNAHGLSNGQRIYFTALTGGTGLALNVGYYIISATTNTFQVSLTSGGAAVNFTADLSAGTWARVVTHSGNLVSRGDYHAPLNALFHCNNLAGSVVLSVGGSNFTITIPASTGNRIVRYKGEDKILTVEESGVEELRMDLLTFQNQTTHPLVAGGSSPYSVTITGLNLVDTSSHMWFWESYA